MGNDNVRANIYRVPESVPRLWPGPTTTETYTTTNTYANIAPPAEVTGQGRMNIMVVNTGLSNAADVQVLTSTDGGVTYLWTPGSVVDLAANTAQPYSIRGPFTHVVVQARAHVGGAQTTIKASMTTN